MNVRISSIPLVSIDAAEWYERGDFSSYVNFRQTATWHPKPSWTMTDMSDVFVYYGDGETGDYGFPPHLEELISLEMKRLGLEEALLWIRNL